MRFVHAADLHLDSPLSGLTPYEGAPVEEIRGATRRALSGLVDACLEEDVDLLLLAGDLYDGDWKDYSTGLFFLQQMNRLRECGAQVIWIRGNHDAASRITRFLDAPAHVRELSIKEPETVELPLLGAQVHGVSYATRDVTENLAVRYPKRAPELLNIGLLHTALDGRPGHASYAPCRLSDLLALGYDYWALGHIHQREVIHREPWVVFAGNLQGRHIGETGAKGATFVTTVGGKIEQVEHRALDVVRWQRIRVDVSSLGHIDDVMERVLVELGVAQREAGQRTLAARVELVGKSRLHAELLSEEERLLAQLRWEAHSLGSVYLESLKNEVLPELHLARLTERKDALGELFSNVEQRISTARVGSAEVAENLLSGLSGLPSDLRREIQADLPTLLGQAERLLLARLLEAETEE